MLPAKIRAAGEISWWSCLRRSGWPSAIALLCERYIYTYKPRCPQTWPDKRRYIPIPIPISRRGDLTNHSTNRLAKYRLDLTLERSLFNRLSTEMTAFGVTKASQ
ncbi:uncharacterized protein Dsimw501_GD28437 [Drosophila simulans]|nr:uncharacterized protein Dsimw501_GD28437 [Drosophila simulans]